MTDTKDVTYGEVQVADSIPNGSGRGSPLVGLVNEIVADESKHRTARCVATYGDKVKAQGDIAAMRKRFGPKIEDKGLEFAIRKVTVNDPTTGETVERHGLWVYVDPGRIVPGEWEKHAEKVAEQARKANEKAKEKAAKDAAASGKTGKGKAA